MAENLLFCHLNCNNKLSFHYDVFGNVWGGAHRPWALGPGQVSTLTAMRAIANSTG